MNIGELFLGKSGVNPESFSSKYRPTKKTDVFCNDFSKNAINLSLFISLLIR
jgi:hypothetical protein